MLLTDHCRDALALARVAESIRDDIEHYSLQPHEAQTRSIYDAEVEKSPVEVLRPYLVITYVVNNTLIDT